MKAKVLKIDNAPAHFERWAFKVKECHYGALGVVLREYGGKNQARHSCYTLTTPPSYGFHCGDVFHRSQFGDGEFIQVAAIISPESIEVHSGVVGVPGSRSGYIVEPSHLAKWLETGIAPPKSTAIGQGSSRAGLLAWELQR
jgi:hypothetical protein